MKIRVGTLSISFALALFGCARDAAPTAFAPPGCPVVSVGQIVRVQVWRNPELTVEAPVRPDGMISVPLLEDLKAAGSTTCELEAHLERDFAEHIIAPVVSVQLVVDGGSVEEPPSVPPDTPPPWPSPDPRG